MVTEYVCGFMFSHERSMVALIEKKRPAWQAGKFNGIGGKIEVGETPHMAMAREFFEETGYATRADDWRAVCVLTHASRDGLVHFFAADIPSTATAALASMTDERVLWCPAHYLAGLPVLWNLHWLIPMAADPSNICGELYDYSNDALAQR